MLSWLFYLWKVEICFSKFGISCIPLLTNCMIQISITMIAIKTFYSLFKCKHWKKNNLGYKECQILMPVYIYIATKIKCRRLIWVFNLFATSIHIYIIFVILHPFKYTEASFLPLYLPWFSFEIRWKCSAPYDQWISLASSLQCVYCHYLSSSFFFYCYS